jgi:hypothetical protein
MAALVNSHDPGEGAMTYFVEGLSGHGEPEHKVRRIGAYEQLPDAISTAQRIVDMFLRKEFKTGMDSGMLLSRYQQLGEHPYIFRDDDKTFNVPGFNHLQYATARSGEICSGKKK